MHHRRHTQLSSRHHDVQYLAIGQFHRVIGHVELDTGYAHFDEYWKLLLHDFLGWIGEDDVVRIIAVRSSFGKSTVLLNDREDGIVEAILRGKCYDCCRPTADCAASASHPSITGWGVPLLEVDV